MLIDFHTHAFPDALAPRAMSILSAASETLTPQTDGTVSGLRASMRKNGVDVSVLLNIATNPHQMHAVNDFAFSQKSDDVIPFGSIHPDAADWSEELDRIQANGLKGVKFHPDYQKFFVDEPKMFPIYRKISELGLITVFHAGFDYAFAPPYKCMPKNALALLDTFSSPVVLAHWGGQGYNEEVLSTLCGLNFYFDVSFGYGVIPVATAQAILEKQGADKLLFGSDMPWHSPTMELSLQNHLHLTQEEKDKINYKNACFLLGL